MWRTRGGGGGGGGSGDLLAANNLSDVADVSTARSNLVAERQHTLHAADFGVVADGSNMAGPLQDLMDAMEALDGGIAVFPDGIIGVSETVFLPDSAAVSMLNRYEFRGGLATKFEPIGATGFPMFSTVDPADSSSTTPSKHYTFYGLNFVGDSLADSIALRFTGCHVHIEQCGFEAWDTAVDLIHVMTSSLWDNTAKSNVSYTYRVRNGEGIWTGATAGNSSSNSIDFNQCRDYCLAGQLAAWRIEGAHNVAINNCTVEGFNPVNSIDIDNSISTSSRMVLIENLYIENTPTNAHIKVKTNTKIVIRNTGTLNSSPLVDVTDSASTASIQVLDCEFAKLKHGGSTARWLFLNPGYDGSIDPRLTSFWTDGTIPTSTVAVFGQASGAATVRGKAATIDATTDVILSSARAFTGFVGIHLNGPTEIRTGTTVTSNALMANGTVSPSLNETTRDVRISVRDSGGTGYVATVPYGVARTTFSDAAQAVTVVMLYVAQIGTMSASRVVTLPAASAYPTSRDLVIADESGTVDGTNTLVVTRAGSDTINGANTTTINTAYGYRRLRSDGTSKWTIVGSS